VTGRTRRPRAACARRLAAGGANVAIAYRQSADKVVAVAAGAEALGMRPSALQADQIINIGSVAGERAAGAGFFRYSVSKADTKG
jgi:3-oxoacyl-[acyl-carrier protein] reductase